MYTVFVASHAVNVFDILALHACHQDGDAVFQNATCTHHTNASVAHVVLSVTVVLFVCIIAFLDHVVYAVTYALSSNWNSVNARYSWLDNVIPRVSLCSIIQDNPTPAPTQLFTIFSTIFFR